MRERGWSASRPGSEAPFHPRVSLQVRSEGLRDRETEDERQHGGGPHQGGSTATTTWVVDNEWRQRPALVMASSAPASLQRDRALLSQFTLAVSAVTPETLERFVDSFTLMRLEPGETFAEAGALELDVGFLLRGTMRCYFVTEEGGEYTKDFFRPLSFVAAPSSLFQRQPSTVTVVALERSELLVIGGDRLERLYDAHAELSRFGRKMIERVYSEREQKEYELAVLDAGGRYRRFQQRFPGLEEQLTLHQLASYLGITTTQLSRVKRR